MKLSEAKKLLKNMRENCLAENKPYKDPKRKEKAEALHIALNALSGAEPEYMSVYNTAMKEANDEWVDKIQAKIYEIKSDPGYGDFGRAWDVFSIVAMIESLIEDKEDDGDHIPYVD